MVWPQETFLWLLQYDFRSQTVQARSESKYNLSDVQQQANVHLSLRHRVIHEIKSAQDEVPESSGRRTKWAYNKHYLKALQGAVGKARALRGSGRDVADDDEGEEKKTEKKTPNHVVALAGQLHRTCARISCEPGFEHECKTLTLLASMLWQ